MIYLCAVITLVSGVVYIENKIGPNMEPWGTPNVNWEGSDKDLPILTDWNLFDRYVWNHLRAVYVKPNQDVRQLSNILWTIVTKAADKSSNMRAVGTPFDNDRWTSFFIQSSAVSVECPHLYADWNAFPSSLVSIWFLVCENKFHHNVK